MTTPPPAQRSLPRSAARARISSASPSLRSSTAREEVAGRLVAGPLRRAGPLDLEAEQRRDHPQARAAARRRRRGGDSAARRRRRRRPAARSSRRRRAAGEQLLLLGPRGGGDREHGARAVDQREAGVEAAAAARATAGSPAPDSIASESASRGEPCGGGRGPRRRRRRGRPARRFLSSSIPRATADSTAEGSARRPRRVARKAGISRRAREMSGQK